MMRFAVLLALGIFSVSAFAGDYESRRPPVDDRLFVSEAVEKKIVEIQGLLRNPYLAWMFGNCFPNTLDTTVHFRKDESDGKYDTFVYTGDIHAMWLRDSGAQVWPYVSLSKEDKDLRNMIAGVILRQFKLINIDPYANAFNDGPTGGEWQSDMTDMNPNVHERKWEIDSHCYPIRLAWHYWKVTGDESVFGDIWLEAIRNILKTFREQQRKDGHGPYTFMRRTERQLDTKCCGGYGNQTLAGECLALADEVETALNKYAIVHHPKYGDIYAYEVDGFGNVLLMDDANVPSLLAMPYLGDISRTDPVYMNTRRFVWSEDNPYFFRGTAGEGIGGPHIGYDMAWPMSIMMRAFTSDDDAEIKECIEMLMTTDAETGFMHESFNVDNPSDFTRAWFAWQNTLFGELIIRLIDDGKLDLLNSITVRMD